MTGCFLRGAEPPTPPMSFAAHPTLCTEVRFDFGGETHIFLRHSVTRKRVALSRLKAVPPLLLPTHPTFVHERAGGAPSFSVRAVPHRDSEERNALFGPDSRHNSPPDIFAFID